MTENLDHSEICVDGLSAEDQERLIVVLDEYMIALEEGRSPDVEILITENPRLEDALRTYLSGLDLIREAAVVKPRSLPASYLTSLSEEYDIGSELGRGAMGIVYNAVDKSSGNAVAVKVLAFGSARDDQLIGRFVREAEAAKSLDHPNIVPVTQIGCDDGVYFYAMKLIEGNSLDQHIASARVDRRRGKPADSLLSANDRFENIARRYAEVADALHCAHCRGIIHRDIKPSNLLRDPDGKLWVTDFGLARVSQDRDLTKSGDLIGTYRYMSPEQARGRTDLIGPHTDVYGLGATLYELLTLRPVFRGQDTAKILNRIDQATPQLPSHWDPSIPRDLETIVLRAIHPDHSKRYQSAKEFADDLTRFANHEPVLARRERGTSRFGQWLQLRSKSIGMVAAVLLLMLGLATGAKRISDLRGSTGQSENLAIRHELVERRLDEALQIQASDSQQDQHYEQTLELLYGNTESTRQVRLLCRTLNQWAMAKINRQDLETAMELLGPAKEHSLSLPDTEANHMVQALTNINLATVVAARGDIEVASEMYQAAESKRQASLGLETQVLPLVLQGYNRLTEVLQTQDGLPDAVAVSKSAIAWSDRIADLSLPSRRQVAIARNNLAECYFELGEYQASVTASQSSLASFREMFRMYPGHVTLQHDMSVVLSNLGRSYASIGEIASAKSAFQEALQLIEPLVLHGRANAELGAEAARIQENLDALLRSEKQLEEAQNVFSKSKDGTLST